MAASFKVVCLIVVTAVSVSCGEGGSALDNGSTSFKNPLDPLSEAEMLTARSVLINASLLCSSCAIPELRSLTLHLPEKQAVKAWLKNQGTSPFDPPSVSSATPHRRAIARTRQHSKTHEIIIDLDSRSVESDKICNGTGQPEMSESEVILASNLTLQHPSFLESVAKRGLEVSDIVCLPYSSGWFGVPADEGKRLLNVECYSANQTVNFYMRPIEGLISEVDLDAKVVRRIVDTASVPLPKAEGTDYRLRKQEPPLLPPLKPISIQQPEGPSFTVEGNYVRWANWRFHVRMDGRAGTVISQAEVLDGKGEWRSVLYQGFVSEIFVPYQDLAEGWYYRSFFDAAEFGLGMLALPLSPLNDCPRHARYLDAVLATDYGLPRSFPNAICIFERYAGDAAWRHTEPSVLVGFELKGVEEVRPKVTLVVRMVASSGNYDYIMDWEFQTDGLIRVQVGLSGIMLVRGSSFEEVQENIDGTPPKSLHGTLVSENTVGVIHDHFISYYLDLDIDGTENSFENRKLRRKTVKDAASLRRSYWDVETNVAQTEADARIRPSLYSPAEYVVVNPQVKTRLGNAVGYKLVPAGNAASLLADDDPIQIRGGFTDNQVWVTPYDRDELWAGGSLGWNSAGEDTLASWSSRDRGIAEKDIVLWYTLGFHHVPSQEDFPIMPTVLGGFELKPNNFFERNPILKAQPNLPSDLPTSQLIQ